MLSDPESIPANNQTCCLCIAASVFGQHQKLEPLRPDKKMMWKREMNCLLSVCDYIVELAPALQTLKDGNTLEVKTLSFVFQI